MSNDLISRSALLKELNEFCGQQRYLVPENIWDMIESAPTAYDVDKVVEQLQSHKDCYEKEAAEYDERGDAENMDISDSIALAYGKAIEIVKAGGVNERNII